MEPCCPPRKLSPRFVAKNQNRSNCVALYFPFSGVLEGVFFWSNFVSSGTESGPRRPLWARIRIGGVQENPGFLIHFEMREVLRLHVQSYAVCPGSGKRGFPYRSPPAISRILSRTLFRGLNTAKYRGYPIDVKTHRSGRITVSFSGITASRTARGLLRTMSLRRSTGTGRGYLSLPQKNTYSPTINGGLYTIT
jgi:hypothetical protein